MPVETTIEKSHEDLEDFEEHSTRAELGDVVAIGIENVVTISSKTDQFEAFGIPLVTSQTATDICGCILSICND